MPVGQPIRIVEVGPRDGLQNESRSVPTDLKARFIAKLAESGLAEIEATSFVSPKWVPQLADATELSDRLKPGPLYSALVPNQKGLTGALSSGYSRIAVFTAASETFCRKNINMSISESLDQFAEIVPNFKCQAGSKAFVRGYLSTAFECPYEGIIDPERVVELALKLFDLGVDEVSLGDTIGVASPREVRRLGEMIKSSAGLARFAFHFHDTRGTAVANVSAGLDLGVTSFDASAGGLGGCPYAPGAGGNLATEDLVYFLQREGYSVHVDLARLARASLEVLEYLGRTAFAKSQLASLGIAQRS